MGIAIFAQSLGSDRFQFSTRAFGRGEASGRQVHHFDRRKTSLRGRGRLRLQGAYPSGAGL